MNLEVKRQHDTETVSFDIHRLTVRTDIDEVQNYVAMTFAHMLRPRPGDSAGEVAVFREGNAYVIEGESRSTYALPISTLLPLIKDEIRLQFMRARPDLLWLHAAVIERGGKALLLAGHSGQGKSTMTTCLLRHGWRYMSDDIAPLRMDTDAVVPFPQTPVQRIHPGREVTAEEVIGLARETVDVADASVCRSTTPVGAIVFMHRESGAKATLNRLERGTGALNVLRNSTNFVDHKGAAVDRAATLARRFPMYDLEYSISREAEELLSHLW